MFFFFYFQCLSSWGYFSATIIPNIVIPTDQDVLKDKCVTGDNFIWGDWCCDLVLYKYNWTGLKLLYCKWECVDTLQLLKVCPTNLPCTRLQMLDYVCIKRKKHFFPVYFNMVLLHPHYNLDERLKEKARITYCCIPSIQLSFPEYSAHMTLNVKVKGHWCMNY